MTQTTMDPPAAAGNGHGTELATRQQRPNPLATRRGIQFESYDEMARFAAAVHKSNLAPKGFDSPEAVFVAIEMGMELGLPPLAALRSIAVINGKPGIYGDAALALVRGSGLLEDFREWYEGAGDTLAAVCESRRRGMSAAEPTRFSVADAKRAGLWGKQGPWSQYPARMLRFRARSFHLRDNFGDVLQGMCTVEEAADIPAAAPDKPADRARRLLDAAPPAGTQRPVSEGQTFVPDADQPPPRDEPDVSAHGTDERPVDLPPDVSTWEQTEAALIDAAMAAGLAESELQPRLRLWLLAKGCKGAVDKIVSKTTTADRLALVEAVRAGWLGTDGRIVTPE